MFSGLLSKEHEAINQALLKALQGLPESVREVANYSMMAGGKRLRPLLTLTTLRLFDSRKPDSYTLAACLEMVHAASLLHDDVLDYADTRRGKTAAHVKYGISPSLLAGDALMAEASKLVAQYNIPSMVECLADAMVRTVAGEAQEIALKGSLDHGLDTYLDVVMGKTAWLLRASCRIAALYAEASPEQVRAVSSYGLNLGIAFQMVDDALDFADEAITGKPTGGDLREGKCTPPILRYAEGLVDDERAAFAQKFRDGSFSDEEVASISRRIREMQLDAQTRAQADEYLHKASQALDELPAKDEREMMRQALDFVRNRKK